LLDLIGGEPLLYSRLEDVVRLASQSGVPASVTTNGLKLGDKAEALVEAGLPLLQISLDGWDEESQTARGNVKRSFERLCDGVRAIQKAKGSRTFPIIRILTAITRVNHDRLERVQQVVADLGVRYWGGIELFLSQSHRSREAP